MGIDPGVNGGVAVLDDKGLPVYVRAFQPSMTERQLADAVQEGLYKTGAVFIEKVGFIRGDGGQGAFTFGAVYGLLRGVALARGFTPHYVYPQAWQSCLGCLSGGNKNVTKRKAQALFPRQKITHAIADALLIACYGRLMLLRGGFRRTVSSTEMGKTSEPFVFGVNAEEAEK